MESSGGGLVVRFMRPWNGSIIMAQEDRSPPGSPPPRGADFANVMGAINWMMVLAAPPLFRSLGRVPTREHVSALVDVYVAYAARGDTYTGAPEVERNHHERIEAAARLRALLETWAPPELPEEITAAARDVLRAEGMAPPAGGWAALQNEGSDPLEDVLMWPEGIPVALRSCDRDAESG
jgi:hypothetical protein